MKRKPDLTKKQPGRPTFSDTQFGPPLLSTLCFAEQLLVWSFRMWMRQNDQNTGALTMLKESWRFARVEPLFGTLDSCMTVAVVTASPSLRIGVQNQPVLTLDEARLIAVVSSLQQNDVRRAKQILCSRLPCAATRIGTPVFDTLARGLAHAGHILPNRCWPLAEWDELGSLTLESDRLFSNTAH